MDFLGKQMSKPWRLLGFGYFQTWVYLIALSPALMVPEGMYEADPSVVGMMLSGFLFASALAVVVANALRSLLENSFVLIGACLVGGAGTLLMIWAPGGDAARVLGIVLADAGSVVLSLWWGKFWSVADTERMSWHLVVSSLFSCVLYLLLVSLPPFVLAFIVPVLPLFSAGVLLLSKDEPRRIVVPSDITILPSRWKLVAAFLVIPGLQILLPFGFLGVAFAYSVVLATSAYSISGLYVQYRLGNLTGKKFARNVIFQLIFVLDVISYLVFYFQIRRSCKEQTGCEKGES